MAGILTAAAEPQQAPSASVQVRVVEAGTAASSSSRSKVLLPVDVIRTLKLQTGDAVLVIADESTKDASFIVGTVWPSFALEAATTRLPVTAQLPTSLQPGQTVSVLPFHATQTKSTLRKPPTATNVTLAVSLEQSTTSTSLAKLGKSDRQMLTIHAKESLTDLECIRLGQQLSLTFRGSLYHFFVSDIVDVNGQPGWTVPTSTGSTTHVCLVSRTTEVSIGTSTSDADSNKARHPTAADKALNETKADPYSKLGGLDRQIAEIKTLIEMPLMSPEIFVQYGLKPPKGVLLYGPPGTGKTSLARAVASATGSSYLTINGPELSSAFHGETESKLRNIFERLGARVPASSSSTRSTLWCQEEKAELVRAPIQTVRVRSNVELLRNC